MIHINLLPVRESRRVEAVKRELAIAGLAGLVIAGLCGATFIVVQAKVSDVKAENKQLQDDIANLKSIVARVDEIDELKQELQRKLDVIGQLKRNKSGPVHMLDELSNATPEKLTLKNVQEVNGRLTLDGYAVNNEIISQFLSNLEQSDWFDEVYLIEIDQDERNGYKVKEFSVTARLVVPGMETDEDESKSGKRKKG